MADGLVIHRLLVSEWASVLGARLSLSVEQIGMKAGMPVAAMFSIVGTVLVLVTICDIVRKREEA